MEISTNVNFNEDTALKKSRKCQLEETYEEDVAPEATEPMKEVAPSPNDEIPEERDMLEQGCGESSPPLRTRSRIAIPRESPRNRLGIAIPLSIKRSLPKRGIARNRLGFELPNRQKNAS